MRIALSLVVALALVATAVVADPDRFGGPTPVLVNNGDPVCVSTQAGQANARFIVTGIGSSGEQITIKGGTGTLTAVPVQNAATGAWTYDGVVSADGTYLADISAYSQACAVMSKQDGGTVTVKIEASMAPATSTRPTNACPLSATLLAGGGNTVLIPNDGGTTGHIQICSIKLVANTAECGGVNEGAASGGALTAGLTSPISNDAGTDCFAANSGYVVASPAPLYTTKTAGDSVYVTSDGGAGGMSVTATYNWTP